MYTIKQERRVRGNLMMIVLYATIMAFVLIGLISLSAAYNSSMKDNSKDFANYQTYKAMTEIACFSYVRAVQSKVITVNEDAEWISSSGSAQHTVVLDEVLNSLTQEPDHDVWTNTDISSIISSAGLDNTDVVLDMQALFRRGTFKLEIKPGIMDLDWSDDETYTSRTEGHIALAPMQVVVDFKARGIDLHETFVVRGLYLDYSELDGTTTYTFGVSRDGGEIKIERKTS